MLLCGAMQATRVEVLLLKQVASLVYQMQRMKRKSIEEINFQHILEMIFLALERQRESSPMSS